MAGRRGTPARGADMVGRPRRSSRGGDRLPVASVANVQRSG